MFVTKHYPSVKLVSDIDYVLEILKHLGCDSKSIPIMAPKMIHHLIQLDNVQLQDAIIIKQDMLSIGGEVAVPKHTFEDEAK